MNFEERIERLTERQAALSESIEMLRKRTAETAANLDRREVRVDKIGEHVDRLADQLERFTAATQLNFDRLTTAMPGLNLPPAPQPAFQKIS